MKTLMKLSEHGANLIKSFESCKLQAYKDQRGIPTIGWGHTLGVHMGMSISQYQADTFFLQDVFGVEKTVNNLVSVPLDQNEFDALCCFVYNIGTTAFSSSHLLMYLNQGNYVLAAQEFIKWDHITVDSKLVVSEGLKNRRITESNLFMLGKGVVQQVS